MDGGDGEQDLDEIADTMETFNAQVTKLEQAVSQYRNGMLQEERLERIQGQTAEYKEQAEDAAMDLLSYWTATRLADQQIDDPSQAVVDHIDETYLDAIDRYFDTIDRIEPR